MPKVMLYLSDLAFKQWFIYAIKHGRTIPQEILFSANAYIKENYENQTDEMMMEASLIHIRSRQETGSSEDEIWVEIGAQEATKNGDISDAMKRVIAKRKKKREEEQRQGEEVMKQDLEKRMETYPLEKLQKYWGIQKKQGRWRVDFQHMGKRYLSALYNTPQEAALAYDKKILELDPSHPFSCMNFPPQEALIAEGNIKTLSRGNTPDDGMVTWTHLAREARIGMDLARKQLNHPQKEAAWRTQLTNRNIDIDNIFTKLESIGGERYWIELAPIDQVEAIKEVLERPYDKRGRPSVEVLKERLSEIKRIRNVDEKEKKLQKLQDYIDARDVADKRREEDIIVVGPPEEAPEEASEEPPYLPYDPSPIGGDPTKDRSWIAETGFTEEEQQEMIRILDSIKPPPEVSPIPVYRRTEKDRVIKRADWLGPPPPEDDLDTEDKDAPCQSEEVE